MIKRLFLGGGVTALSAVYQQLFSILVVGVLARYLKPEDFALIAMILLFSNFVTMLSSVGFGQAIINKKHISENQISTLFWLGLALGVCSVFVLNLLRPIAVSIFGQNQLSELIPLFSFIFVMRPLYIIQRRINEKKMKFARLAVFDVVSVTISGMVAVYAAFASYGVYALVIQLVLLHAGYLVIFMFSDRWPGKLYFNFSEVKGLVEYSIKYKIGEVIVYFEKNIDLLILSKALSASGFGLYSFLMKVVSSPLRKVTQVMVTVLFPYFSKEKDNFPIEKLASISSFSILLLFPLCSVAFVYSEYLVRSALGEEWLGLVGIFPIAALGIALQLLDGLLNIYYPSVGKVTKFINLSILKFIVTAMLVLGGSIFGLKGACVMYTVSKLVNYILSGYYLYKYTEDCKKQFTSVFMALLYSMFLTALTVLIAVEVGAVGIVGLAFSVLFSLIATSTFYLPAIVHSWGARS
ncbi:oligosaccharide flippase family protein [uncultured Pseudoteredinibacter sp.]|uniref:oligosaccharide flippase family protein n=1 Tax=uncultured Pseudoteredinibacter sp. TaxID=1641701 RepID=UPI002620144C|nr:oligosaccharide flippase family protein [uncultured Pseudoteredinibacter sp.]